MSDDNEEMRTLFIGNLSDKITEELLFELFLQAGPVESVHIPKDSEGRQKTFGFVTFKHEESVPYTIALLEGIVLCGRTLNIKPRTGNDMPYNPYMNLLLHQSSNSRQGMHNHGRSEGRHRGYEPRQNHMNEEQLRMDHSKSRNQIPCWSPISPRPGVAVWSTFNQQFGLFNPQVGTPNFGYHLNQEVRQFFPPIQLPMTGPTMMEFTPPNRSSHYNRDRERDRHSRNRPYWQ